MADAYWIVVQNRGVVVPKLGIPHLGFWSVNHVAFCSEGWLAPADAVTEPTGRPSNSPVPRVRNSREKWKGDPTRLSYDMARDMLCMECHVYWKPVSCGPHRLSSFKLHT